MFPATLRITSCMADNAEATCRAIAAWLGQHLGIATEFVDCIPWQERERQLDAGLIHVCWICGLPYVWKTDTDASVIEPCVAPVMAAARYAGAPVYYSDIVVRRDSPYRTFADLRGTAWAYKTRKGLEYTHGAKTFQGVIQALARCQMGDGMLRTRKQYPVALTVHDAEYFLAPESEGQAATDYAIEQLCVPPVWAPDLPLAAEGGFGKTLKDC